MVLCTEDAVSVKRWTSDEQSQTRMSVLQARKKTLEEQLVERNEELRRLCIQEAELTGSMPSEVPLEPGEPLPAFRRRVGTTFAYPQNLINKLKAPSEVESVAALELERQVQAGISEAALGLANNGTASKAVRRKNRLVYQQSQRRLSELDERLGFLLSTQNISSSSHSMSHQIQTLPFSHYHHGSGIHHAYARYKKKPRPPVDYDLNGEDKFSGQSEYSGHSTGPNYVLQDRLERTSGSNNDSTSSCSLVPNTHLQLAPHQQYDGGGLGGYWMSLDTGETIWCSVEENHWQRDKRFGSLDRSKVRPLQHKWSSPPAMETTSVVQRNARASVDNQDIHRVDYSMQHVISSPKQDDPSSTELVEDWHLVRAQSMGSVGVIKNDDSVSCCREKSNTSTASRKYKQKKWYETSLDAPQSDAQPPAVEHAHLQANRSNILPSHNQQQRQVTPPVRHSPQPQQQCAFQTNTPTNRRVHSTIAPLEIPAETTHFAESVSVQSPKNCTVVQPGQWKPYREVTKPFEMSDFYKYSTKFRNRNGESKNVKTDAGDRVGSIYVTVPEAEMQNGQRQAIVTEQSESDGSATQGHPVFQKGVYQPLQPMKCQPYKQSNNNYTKAGVNFANDNNHGGVLWYDQAESNNELNQQSVSHQHNIVQYSKQGHALVKKSISSPSTATLV